MAQTVPGSAQYRVKALFFDVFGTLADWRTGIAQELRRILSHVAMRWNRPRLRNAWPSPCANVEKDVVFFELTAILNYLEATRPTSLLVPADGLLPPKWQYPGRRARPWRRSPAPS